MTILETPETLAYRCLVIPKGERLSSEGINHIYIDGGKTIQRFLAAGLVDELTITVIPILLGAGIPLFGLLDGDVNLSCIDTKQYDFGVVQLKYRVQHDA